MRDPTQRQCVGSVLNLGTYSVTCAKCTVILNLVVLIFGEDTI